jgi:hypothetical protein
MKAKPFNTISNLHHNLKFATLRPLEKVKPKHWPDYGPYALLLIDIIAWNVKGDAIRQVAPVLAIWHDEFFGVPYGAIFDTETQAWRHCEGDTGEDTFRLAMKLDYYDIERLLSERESLRDNERERRQRYGLSVDEADPESPVRKLTAHLEARIARLRGALRVVGEDCEGLAARLLDE